MEKFRKPARWLLSALCIVILFLLAMVCLDIYADGVGFSAEAVAHRLGIVAPTLCICLASALVCAVFLARGEKSVDKQSTKLYKPAKAAARLGAARGAILAAAAVFILLGVMNGGARDVLIKAINICTECIGLG